MKVTNHYVIVGAQPQPTNLGIGAVFGFLALIALIATYFWQIFLIVVAVGVCLIAWLLLSDSRLKRDALAYDADRQNRLFIAGDPRGIYGDDYEGSEQR